MSFDIAVVIIGAMVSAFLSEGLSWLLIYRTASYKKLSAEVERLQKKKAQGDDVPAVNLSKGEAKRRERIEADLTSLNQQLNMIKMKSVFALMLTMGIFYGILSAQFDGQILARLPFEPFSMFQSITHRNVRGADFRDTGMAFIYVLANMTIRPTFQKILGRPSQKSSMSMFDMPKQM